jgi:hypothetical protein
MFAQMVLLPKTCLPKWYCCPKHVCPNGTIAQKIFAQTYGCPKARLPKKLFDSIQAFQIGANPKKCGTRKIEQQFFFNLLDKFKYFLTVILLYIFKSILSFSNLAKRYKDICSIMHE